MPRVLGLLFILFLLATPPLRAAEPPLVRIVSTDFVLPAKFEQLGQWAVDAGYQLDWRRVESPASAIPLDGVAMLIVDSPRPADRAAIEKALGSLDQLATPWLAVGGGATGFGHLDPAVARQLIGYYAGGGEPNLRAFVAALPRALAGKDLGDLPLPQRLPATGLYHPDAPGPFATAQEFRAWAILRGDRPVAAFAISEGQIRDMQTRLLTALAASADAHGLLAAFFWYDERDPQALSKVVRQLNARVLINFTHMQDGEARKTEFEQLDVPVLQGLSERAATPDQWRASMSGITGMSAPVMLSVPEGWGISDPLVLGAVENGEVVPIPEQVELLTAKIARLVALRDKAAREKHLALFFWNYPTGEKNMAASNLNLPQTLAKLSRDLAASGYDVQEIDEKTMIAGGQALLRGLYHPETLEALAGQGLAARLPLATYKAWLAQLPSSRQAEVEARWGKPEASPAVHGDMILIPRLALGKLLILPQPPRGGNDARAYHDQASPPDHRYLATYLWIRAAAQADAIIHFGTHGTQEWTPGKDRGLWAADWPFLLLGDLPVFYPYIQDNVAEALQARRRGRAVTISHQTPAFAPSGLYEELRDIHALIHDYAQLDVGPVRDRIARDIVRQARESHLDADMGWDDDAVARDFHGYYTALHDHLHQLARTSTPLGLHVFGEPSSDDERLTTVMQQLGPAYLKVLAQDPVEAFAEDAAAIRDSVPYRILHHYLRAGGDVTAIANPALRAQIEQALAYDQNLAAPGETQALLAGLAGGFIRAGPGGDPVRNPEVPSGRNLYAFEAEKIPAQAAYEEGGRAFSRLLAAYAEKNNGALPTKIAVSLFSGETIRTLGIGEGQLLHALGLRPVWGRGGRVERLDIVPLSELGRPRIDVLVQPTSVYRDQFDAFMRLLADGIDRIAALDEDTGPAAHARALEAKLADDGMTLEQARTLSRLRIFTNAPGDYGTGLPDRLTRGGKSDAADWRDEVDLADPYIARMGYAYGARNWGLSLEATSLFARQLEGVDAAVLVRSSNLHGMVSTDHPFEHLGGLSLAVRRITGKAPDLFVTDMRDSESRVTTAGAFLSNELRVRYLNPQWIKAMQAEGYAGANAIAGVVNNLWGWQVADPASVRADQWQAMHDTYVRDNRKLEMNSFFERVHPSAQLQLVERMLEAIRRDYWQPDAATRQSLEQRRAHLQSRVAAAERAAARQLTAQGFGLTPSAPGVRVDGDSKADAPRPQPPLAQAPTPPTGRILLRQQLAPPMPSMTLRGQVPALATLLALFLAGVLLERRARRSSNLEKALHVHA